MKYLMWDVDGTLLLTGMAGKDALEKVIKEFYYLDAFEFNENLAGKTDSYIFKSVVERLRGRCNVGETASLMIRYHMELPHQMPKHNGHLMKNVEKTLQYIDQKKEQYTNCLLTGNTKTGAQIKLEYYKLDHYFDFNHSAFGEISEDRSEIARVLYNRFYIETNGSINPKDIIIIGDTPNDAACANAIGVRSLIILNGSGFKREDFDNAPLAQQPWKIIDALPDDPADFERILDEE